VEIDDACAPFDITAVAAGYSALSGVLAGFAFTAVILPLSLSRNSSRHFGPAMACFTAAFFTLTLAAIQYSVLAGEIGQGSLRGRAVHTELVNAIPMSLAVLLLLFGLCQLFQAVQDRVEVQPAYRLLTTMTATVTPILVMVFCYTIMSDLVVFRRQMQGSADCTAEDSSMAVGAGVLVAGALAVAIVAWQRPALALSPLTVPVVGVVAVLALAAYSAGVSAFMPSDYVTPTWLQLGLFSVVVLASVGFSVVVTGTRARDPAAASPGAGDQA
jgi:hypothetical protein